METETKQKSFKTIIADRIKEERENTTQQVKEESIKTQSLLSSTIKNAIIDISNDVTQALLRSINYSSSSNDQAAVKDVQIKLNNKLHHLLTN